MPPLRTRNNSRTLDMEPTPQRPGLSIVAPIPRTVSFPSTHALSIPYTLDAPSTVSPSSSPFEPDLSPVALRPHTPEILSPVGEYSSPIRERSRSRSLSRSPSRNGSRKLSISSSSTAPKKGDSNYIKRPENAFILFRRKCCEDRNMSLADLQSTDPKDKSKKPRQADLSKSISQQWKSLPAVERQYWEDLAKEKKKEHEELYPGYVYRPQRARDKDGNVKPRRPRGSRQKERAEKALLAAEDTAAKDETLLSPVSPTPSPRASLNIVIPAGMRHRSASLPNVSGNQILEIPLVYNNGGSCPNSPSSRECAPGHEYVKGQSMSDEAVDWMAKGDGFMPWMPSGQFSWSQQQFYGSQQPSYFPLNPDFSFAGANASDIMTSPTMSSSSVSSQAASLSLPTPYLSYSQPPSCDPCSNFPPFPFDTDPSYNGMGLSPDTDLSSTLAHGSLVWEQSHPVWGPSSSISQYDFGLDCLFSSAHQQSEGWELGAVPPMELGLPTAHVDGETTPTEPISTLTL